MSVVSEHEVQGSLRAQVIEAGANWSSRQHRLVRLVAALDASGEWAVDGSPTCAHWVATALDLDVSTAREWLRIGKALAELWEIDAALASGRLSYSKVRALTRIATPENQSELCQLAEGVPASRLVCALASWQVRRETPEQTEARQHATRHLAWRPDVDGMLVVMLRLPPDDAADLTASVDAQVRAVRVDASADAWPSVGQQRADALMALVRGGGASVATEVVIHVRADGCSLDDGTPIAGSIVERIAPRSFMRVLIHDAERRPINASGRHRHPTARQRRVVRERDRACVDCGATDFLDYDHVPPYEVTRRTVISELRLRCWNCHHRRPASERVHRYLSCSGRGPFGRGPASGTRQARRFRRSRYS